MIPVSSTTSFVS